MIKEFIIFDTEYTSWKGNQENGREEWQKEEVVQIGAIKVSYPSLEIIEELDVYIKPTLNPVLSDYFTDLTKITNEKIEKDGVSFIEGYKKFYDFSKDLICFSHGWGKPEDFDEKNLSKIMQLSDGYVMEINLDINNIEENDPPNYKNIAFWFKKMYEKNGINVKSQASGEIAKILGVEDNISGMGIDAHNALYDVYSILEGIKYFKAEKLF